MSAGAQDDAHDDDAQPSYGLVMPFVSVSSKGGPHDDRSYVAGWEMGLLDAELGLSRPVLLDRVIHTANVDQADLLAMKHGYRSSARESDVDGWSHLRLELLGESP